MIDISIPFYYDNTHFYSKFIDLLKKSPELFKEKITISSIYGNFPWSYWNGTSNFTNKFIGYNEIAEFDKKNFLPIIFDISNLNLNEQDLEDRKLNLILDIFNNGGNFISTSDFNIINFISENYPNYRIIFSDKGHFINEYNLDIINLILENENIYEIILSETIMDSKTLEKIKRKDKVRIKICDKCDRCKQYINCHTQEDILQYNFSEKSIYDDCENIFKYNNLLRIPYEINHFQTLGFNKFLIDSPPKKMNMFSFNMYLLLSLAKKDNHELLKKVLFND